jgi:uncharacterized membrane protein YqgA involved in biofilm formation
MNKTLKKWLFALSLLSFVIPLVMSAHYGWAMLFSTLMVLPFL